MQTFDAVDGKQARRTNSSSPLGELFDHGNLQLEFKLVYSVLRNLVWCWQVWILCRMWCACLCCKITCQSFFFQVQWFWNRCELIIFILSISLSPWLLEARQCVERLPSGFGSFQLSHFTSQPGNSEFLCSCLANQWWMKHQAVVGSFIVLNQFAHLILLYYTYLAKWVIVL